MNDQSFFELLKYFKKSVDDYIFEFLPDNHDILEINLLFEMMRDYPSRSGKGLRPGLIMLFNRAFGGDDEKSLNSAAAIEIFQNWIVIHDDIEDQSDLRRGQPALHIKHGVPLALNAGDALAGKMWELILKNESIIGTEKALKVFNEFLIMYARTTEGQHIELGWATSHKWNITENDYFNMCQRKTAWYTCISPSWIGALTAGADNSLREAFIQFGRDLGVAFQIQDDILNLVGEAEKYGKEIGGDILEGKRTLVLIHLLENCEKSERDFISSSIDVARVKKDISVIGDVIKLMRKYGSIEYAATVSHKLAGRARDTYFKSIDSHVDDQYRPVITDFINFMVEREL